MGKTEDTGETADTKTIPLKYPIQFGDESITEVTVRRPKGKDLKGLHDLKGSHDDQLKLISRLIDRPLRVVEDMDLGTDLQKVMAATMDFLPDGQ